jgi:hypothetical protein
MARYHSPEWADAIICKHFFSGAVAHVQGNIFATLTPVGIAFKLPEASGRALLADDAQPLQYFPAALIKRGYVAFPEPSQLTSGQITELITESIEHVLTP